MLRIVGATLVVALFRIPLAEYAVCLGAHKGRPYTDRFGAVA